MNIKIKYPHGNGISRIENAVNAIYASRVEAEITEEAANEAGLLKAAGTSE